MKSLKTWIRRTITNLVDPEREKRIDYIAKLIHDGLRREQSNYSVDRAFAHADYDPKEVALARDKVYRTILLRGWRDGKLSVAEQAIAAWVAKSLAIPGTQAHQINVDLALSYFGTALADAMADGILTEDEERRLNEIAASVGLSMAEFVRRFFYHNAEGFLRGIFLACVEDNHLSKQEWEFLLGMAQKFGLSRHELLEAIVPQAQQFVERVLADAKSDGRLSRQEDSTLNWLLANLLLPPQYRIYVEAEIAVLRTLTEIQDGQLPSIASPGGVETRAGEIVHLHERAIWRRRRTLKSGIQSEDHHGTITLTDNRLIFTSPTRSQVVSYRKILSHSGGCGWLEVQVANQPLSSFFFDEHGPLTHAVFYVAVAMANQTIVGKPSGSSRHIPRDVRQRVWQRYGGRCADCGANDYLEFDHIIPKAKGGSNSDSNVQLLCRRCNLKKSDYI